MTLGWVGWIPDFLLFALLPLLFLGGLIVIGVLLIGSDKSSGPERGHALAILEERYARGEITREEFLERREVLRGDGAS
jgi:putative membrane protein